MQAETVERAVPPSCRTTTRGSYAPRLSTKSALDQDLAKGTPPWSAKAEPNVLGAGSESSAAAGEKRSGFRDFLVSSVEGSETGVCEPLPPHGPPAGGTPTGRRSRRLGTSLPQGRLLIDRHGTAGAVGAWATRFSLTKLIRRSSVSGHSLSTGDTGPVFSSAATRLEQCRSWRTQQTDDRPTAGLPYTLPMRATVAGPWSTSRYEVRSAVVR
jgi:hypothetical protein